MAKQLYDYWFVQFDFPNENGKPYKSSGGEMVWNEKLRREIPKGWSSMSIGDYAPCMSMRTRDAGAGKRHALVESFAADVKRTAVCRYSFAAAQEMRHLIYIVNIE